MRTITGDKNLLGLYILKHSKGRDVIFPENGLDIEQQANIMSEIDPEFEGDIYTISSWVISDSEVLYIVDESLELNLFDDFIWCNHK